MELETEVLNGREWLVKWEGIMKELGEDLGGKECGEWHLRQMVTEFGREVEDLEWRGRRVEWFA